MNMMQTGLKAITATALPLCCLPLSLSQAAPPLSETEKTNRENNRPVRFSVRHLPQPATTVAASDHQQAADKAAVSRQPEPLVAMGHLPGKPAVVQAGHQPRNAAPLRKTQPQPRRAFVTNPDDQRPDDQFTTRLFGRDLVIGGEFEVRAEQRGNYALSDTDNDRETYREKLELEFKYDINERIKTYLETKLVSSQDHRADRKRHLDSLERGESWIDISRPLGKKTLAGVRIGRQNFAEKREWWWDEDLDAVRFYYAAPKLSYEIGFARELGGRAANQPLPENKKDIQRILARLKWEYRKGHKLELFALDHNDQSSTPQVGEVLPADQEDKSDARLNWYGIRARGKHKFKLEELGKFRLRYWADYGIVRGDETVLDFNDVDTDRVEVNERFRQSVRGSAFDVGITLKSRKLAWKPSFTLGLAQGSGDDNPADGVDHAFRQTGLNDNNGKFNGVDSFRYYGELLRPQLSNIRISTASIGIPLRRSSSLEVLYHRYDQVEPDTRLDSRLRIRPNGQNRALGDEIDIVLGLEEWKKLELEFVGSIFRAGAAFGDREGERSHFVGMKINYNF